MPLHQRRNVAVLSTGEQIAFPPISLASSFSWFLNRYFRAPPAITRQSAHSVCVRCDSASRTLEQSESTVMLYWHRLSSSRMYSNGSQMGRRSDVELSEISR